MDNKQRIIHPFGVFGSQYRVSARGLVFYKLLWIITVVLCFYLIFNALIYLTVLNPQFYVACAAYLVVSNILLAKALSHADRVSTDTNL